MKTYLVTGGAGFIGSHLVDRLIADGHTVRVLDNFSTGTLENFREQPMKERLDVRQGDVSRYEDVVDAARGVDGIFHCAALARIQPSIKDPLSSHATNVTGTLNVLWAAKNLGIPKVVFSSSSSVYGRDTQDAFKESDVPNPGSPYALQKYIGEQYCALFGKLYNLPTVCLRYFNVYGTRMIEDGGYAAVIGIFMRQYANGEKLTITDDGEQRRDFTYVDDVVDANVRAMESSATGVFNIGTGANVSVNEIAARIGGDREYIAKRPGEYRWTLADNAKAKKELGWKPTMTFAQGMDVVLGK